MNVYVVLEGYYDDKEVVAVFSCKEWAERYIAAHTPKVDCRSPYRLYVYVLDNELESLWN